MENLESRVPAQPIIATEFFEQNCGRLYERVGRTCALTDNQLFFVHGTRAFIRWRIVLCLPPINGSRWSWRQSTRRV
jgi:hypothetical protein